VEKGKRRGELASPGMAKTGGKGSMGKGSDLGTKGIEGLPQCSRVQTYAVLFGGGEEEKLAILGRNGNLQKGSIWGTYTGKPTQMQRGGKRVTRSLQKGLSTGGGRGGGPEKLKGPYLDVFFTRRPNVVKTQKERNVKESDKSKPGTWEKESYSGGVKGKKRHQFKGEVQLKRGAAFQLKTFLIRPEVYKQVMVRRLSGGGGGSGRERSKRVLGGNVLEEGLHPGHYVT